eukprot:CAMPEP_0198528400 /NCGR_PEP_ID=MMETSP1462-20131121/25120_1 /TAXON_ID=1333877 /ORGANISM="Brandtodinium nutriculum, Strain RCC3387" /LENGTH=64 /DNA_ID=CAMNT_0044258225 /DNA_START=60 /DNA_END=251 /DNA_ORIENTATION=+
MTALNDTTNAPKDNSMQSVRRGPNFSMTLPSKKRVITSKDTAAMFALPIVDLQAFPHTQAATRS